MKSLKTVLKRESPFIISALFHLAAFLLVANLQNGAGKGELNQDKQGQGQGATNDKVQPKITEIELIPPPPDKEAGTEPKLPKPKEQPKDGVTECENNSWYGGIGIQQNWTDGSIDEVYPGYPAEQAGLKVGDQIRQVSSNEGSEIRGTPGTKISMWIHRPSSNESFLVEITRGKICLYKKIEKKKELDLGIPQTFESEGP